MNRGQSERKREAEHGRYDVFLSHSSRLTPDHHELVDALASALVRRGLKVFWDRNTFEGGEPLLPTLEAAIERSRVGILVLTRLALRSPWVEFERETMHRCKLAKRMAVLVLKLEPDCPVPSDVEPAEVIEPEKPVITSILADQVEAVIRRASRRL
jgi:hypothetical protein